MKIELKGKVDRTMVVELAEEVERILERYSVEEITRLSIRLTAINPSNGRPGRLENDEHVVFTPPKPKVAKLALAVDNTREGKANG